MQKIMSLKFIEISRNLSHPAKMKLCAQKAEKPFWSYLALPTLNGPYQALLDINICAASRLFFWSLKTVEFKNTFWHKIFSYDPGSVMATPNVQWPNYILNLTESLSKHKKYFHLDRIKAAILSSCSYFECFMMLHESIAIICHYLYW